MTAHQNRRFAIVKRQGPGGPHILTTTTATAARTTPTTATSVPVTTATTVVVVTATSSSSSSSSSTSSTTSVSSTSTTSTTSASTRSTTSTTPTTTAAPITVAALSTSSLVTTPRPTTSRVTSASPTSSPSMSLTPTATPDSGAPIGTIIGVVGAGLVGAIALAAVAGWYFRRTFRKKSDFNRSKFIRNSTAIPDAVDYTHEKVAMGSKNALNLARANTLHDKDINQRGPRPPSVIERRMNATGGAPGADMPSYNPGEVVGANQGYPAPQAGYPYGAYPQQPYGQASYPAYDYQQQQPAQYYNYAANNVSSAYTPPSEYQQSQLTRRPSGPGAGSPYLQRKASNGVALQQPAPIRHDAGGYTGPEAGDEDFLNMAKHESVTPFQQQQYAEINRQLNAGPGQVTVTDSAGKTSNVEAGDANAAPGRALPTTYSSLGPSKPADPAVPSADAKSGTPMDRNPQQNYFQPAPVAAPGGASVGTGLRPAQGQTAQAQKNRESVFDADDAYGGI